MKKQKMYMQCRMEQQREHGIAELVGWIEERGAKVGARIELKGEEGLWVVVTAGGPAVEIQKLREKQAADRASLPSIKEMA